MALLAGGVAVREITSSLRYPWAVDALALMCIAVSITVAVGAYYHWRGTQSDMRRSRPLHAPWLIPALSGAVSLIAVACCVVVLL